MNAETVNSKVVWLLTVFLLASVHIAEAQEPEKVPRVGYLTASLSAITDALRHFVRDCTSSVTSREKTF